MRNDQAELIRRGQDGDLSAFNRLVEAHQEQIYNLCLRFLGRREDAEDATQEAFIAAYHNIARFRGGSFRAWLTRIATNACYDEMRRRRRRPTMLLEDAVSLPAPAADGSPEAYAMRAELARQIQAGLATLAPQQRMVLILCDIQGLSYEEIAQAMGSSLGTVRSRLSRARSHLRDYLRERWELFPHQFRHISDG